MRNETMAELAPVVAQLQAYFAGELTDFDLPLQMHGTEFQRRVWAALCEIPYGETISYGELARWVGNPKASRAVGLANGRNPVAIVVPCHRVIGADGSLTGYGGGLDRKVWLLEHEASYRPGWISGQARPTGPARLARRAPPPARTCRARRRRAAWRRSTDRRLGWACGRDAGWGWGEIASGAR